MYLMPYSDSRILNAFQIYDLFFTYKLYNGEIKKYEQENEGAMFRLCCHNVATLWYVLLHSRCYVVWFMAVMLQNERQYFTLFTDIVSFFLLFSIKIGFCVYFLLFLFGGSVQMR